MQGKTIQFLAALLALALGACGSATADDDDAWPSDDDAQADLDGDYSPDWDDWDVDGDGVANDEDLDPRDPAVRRGTGTIEVTYEMLAVLADGQTVTPEIIIVQLDAPDGPNLDRSQYLPTGVRAPGTVEVDAARYFVSLKLNEPDAPVAERFFTMEREIIVTRGASTPCPLFVGRDLTGTWVSADDPDCDVVHDATCQTTEVSMISWPTPFADGVVYPCDTELWALEMASDLCLIEGDRLWMEHPGSRFDGHILDNGTTLEYTQYARDEEHLYGPYVFHRE